MTKPEQTDIVLTDVWGSPILEAQVDLEEKKGAGGSHWVADVEAPGYLRDRAVLDFYGRAELTLLIDPKTAFAPEPVEAAELMFRLLLGAHYVGGNSLESFVSREPIHVQPDRAFYKCDPSLARDVAFSRAYEDAPGGMHSPPAGRSWEQVGSWKSTDPTLNVQTTFWTAGAAKTYLEFDLDRNRGAAHVFDALIRHPISGQDDPRILAQLLVLYRGLPLAFPMTPDAGPRGVRAGGDRQAGMVFENNDEATED